MVVNGFYKTRIVHLLLQSEHALNTNQIWERFHAAYYHELKMLPGKTQLASVQSAITRLANNKDIVRMLDQSSENVLYKYYIKHKHSYAVFQVANMRSESSCKKKKRCRYAYNRVGNPTVGDIRRRFTLTRYKFCTP